MNYYILNKDHSITKAVSMFDYLGWDSLNKGIKVVGKYETSKYRVSTVFLGLDHSFEGDDSEPILFETLVFDGELDGEMDRYYTWDEAVKGHAKMVKRCGGIVKQKEEEKIKSRFEILDL